MARMDYTLVIRQLRRINLVNVKLIQFMMIDLQMEKHVRVPPKILFCRLSFKSKKVDIVVTVLDIRFAFNCLTL